MLRLLQRASGTTVRTLPDSGDRAPSRRAAAPPGVDEGPRAERQLALRGGPEAHPRGEPQHDLRGGALPEHRRVLGPRHRDVPDPRRHVHARVPVLLRPLRQAGAARRTRSSRCASRRRRSAMQLKHVVVTSVDRDDLPDRGAGHYAATIRALQARVPEASVEVLTPDFLGVEEEALASSSPSGRKCSTTTSRPCAGSTVACAAPRRRTTRRCGCWRARRSWRATRC